MNKNKKKLQQNELRSILKDWILLGLQLRHTLPVIDNIQRLK